MSLLEIQVEERGFTHESWWEPWEVAPRCGPAILVGQGKLLVDQK